MPYNEPEAGDVRRTLTPTLDMCRTAHQLRVDGFAWRIVHQRVCQRHQVRRDAFSVADLIRAHAAQFPKHRYPLGPATGGTRHV